MSGGGGVGEWAGSKGAKVFFKLFVSGFFGGCLRF